MDIEKIKQKRREDLAKGVEDGKVFLYPDSLFELLRPYNLGGFPLSIRLFINEYCNGNCYDSAILMQLAFDEANVVIGDIESLRIISQHPNDAEHAFVVTKTEDGLELVFDTSAGLIFDKDFYYDYEKVVEKKILTKEECMSDPMIVEILTGNYKENEQSLLQHISDAEKKIKESRHIGTTLYRDKVLMELDNFKKEKLEKIKQNPTANFYDQEPSA